MNIRTVALMLITALAFTGCAAQEDRPEPESQPQVNQEPESGFPLTLEIPASEAVPAQQITLDAQPERIAALTYETAELVAHLGAMDRLVLVQESLTKPVLSSFSAEMAEVSNHARTEGAIDAEQVLAAEPDLVLITARRGLEQELSDVLSGSGVPVLILPNQWATSTDVVANIELVGEAIGAVEEAEALVEELSSGLHADLPEDPETAPRVLMLSNQAGQPFVIAGSAFPLEILHLAGGHDVGQELGFVRSGPISAEEVIATQPDAILLVDMNGSGMTAFEPLLENEAVASLSAVTDGRVLLVEGKRVQALGFTATIEGREQIATWLEEDASTER